MRLLVPLLGPLTGSWNGSGWHGTALCQGLCWLCLTAPQPCHSSHGTTAWMGPCTATLQCHHNAAAKAEHHFLPLLLLQKGDGEEGA